MERKKLEEVLQKNNQPKFRLEQIEAAVYRDGVFSFEEISTLPKDLRNILEKEIKILPFETINILESQDKKSVKALLKTKEGQLLETVLMSLKPSLWSVCVSSQIGCPMGCCFCATGGMGFKRNLTAEEIEGQVLFWKQYLNKERKMKKDEQKKDISNIVYMGMGEPFLNFDNVKRSFDDLINPKLFGFGARSISVSTVGIPEGILRLAQELPQINLAISLHFADDNQRSLYMPVNKKYNLDKLKETLKKYFQYSNRKIMFEYIMLSEINDRLEDARKLTSYIKSIGKLQLLHVNLIGYNSTGGKFKGSSPQMINRFKDYLLGQNINTTIRKSLGQEIQGACGQLAGKMKKFSRDSRNVEERE